MLPIEIVVLLFAALFITFGYLRPDLVPLQVIVGILMILFVFWRR